MIMHTLPVATHGVNMHEQLPWHKLLPVEQLAQLHGIVLPQEHELPASYSMRRWLTRRIATMQGHHKEVYRQIKSDPERLEKYRASTRRRVQAWRARHSQEQHEHAHV
jgi:hypothetical protein